MKSVEMYGTELRTTIEDLNAEPEFSAARGEARHSSTKRTS
ncbi:hypothetical protein [Epibacterium ulvae]|nr:hypothetical protein [Epibacterium ulvae]